MNSVLKLDFGEAYPFGVVGKQVVQLEPDSKPFLAVEYVMHMILCEVGLDMWVCISHTRRHKQTNSPAATF